MSAKTFFNNSNFIWYRRFIKNYLTNAVFLIKLFFGNDGSDTFCDNNLVSCTEITYHYKIYFYGVTAVKYHLTF